ncbi:Glutathione peroxidase [Handroanthus impetiginosus]|uniref:Glutathione peroxidase n=1 Tax=Handroanthus impetiginosus TaxID=429701 RepID=A0A2G9H305_9LAMI|nr:Glutathione peroxidase [Handroanthus impetiginosus]
MASMAFSSVFSAPLHSLALPKLQLSSNSAPMVFLDLSNRTSLGSLKSTFIRDGLSNLSPILSGVSLKSRSFATTNAGAATEKTIHDYTVKDIDGKDVSLSKFKGKVLLIVNVASRCGLTSSNYTELSHIYEKYKTQGFEILAFPCNQFGGQEPGTNPEIKQFACTRYKAEFPIFDKVDVNGPSTAPVYQFLKSSAGGFLGDLIKWNFEKFLVDKNGKVVQRYPPPTSPFQIEKDIQKLLAA